VLNLLDDPDLAHNLTLHAARDVKPLSDHYLAVFVFMAESQEDGTLLLRAISTTVVGIQRYTTKRLRYQGIYVTENPNTNHIVWQTLRAHFRAQQEDTDERLRSIGRSIKLRWTKDFPNGAGDLADSPEFVMTDPDIAELEKLLSTPDTRRDIEGSQNQQDDDEPEP
jgi:hypothetical protein